MSSLDNSLNVISTRGFTVLVLQPHLVISLNRERIELPTRVTVAIELHPAQQIPEAIELRRRHRRRARVRIQHQPHAADVVRPVPV